MRPGTVPQFGVNLVNLFRECGALVVVAHLDGDGQVGPRDLNDTAVALR